MLFDSGRIVYTEGIAALSATDYDEAMQALRRHLQGDWGELDERGGKLNSTNLKRGGRLLSSYTLKSGTRIYIITEPHLFQTSIMLWDEY
jgi:hypothetical protein